VKKRLAQLIAQATAPRSTIENIPALRSHEATIET
jgi:hypothetical protein